MKKFLLFFFMLCLCVFFAGAQIQKVVFTSNRDGTSDIYSMLSNGTNITRLTNNVYTDQAPRFSPDASKIIYNTARPNYYQIYRMDADGTNEIALTTPLSAGHHDFGASWSPDGSKIIFNSSRISLNLSNNEIYVMDANGSNPTRLTTNSSDDISPAWSSTNKIVFSSNRDGNYEIYTMNTDGSNQQRITYAAGDDVQPSWSPDGSKIAFVSYRDGNYEVYTMNADGTSQTRISYNIYNDLTPTWSPDGTRLIFASDVGTGRSNIYTINSNGTNFTQITTLVSYDVSPHWAVWNPTAPVAMAGPAPTVSSTSSLVNGIVSAGGFAATVTFLYGTDEWAVTNGGEVPAIGIEGPEIVLLPPPIVNEVPATPNTVSAFTSNAPVSANLENLTTNTTYYYRVKATNSLGTTLGPVQSFVPALLLPVSLVAYDVQLQANNHVIVSWRTAQEFNNSHFIIEKSTDGLLFVPAGSVQSKGNSNSITDYTFTDLSFTSGSVYYRLKQVDRDGKSTGLGIRKVNQGGSQIPARLYPNPVTNNFFTVETGASTTLPVTYKIVTLTGQYVQEGLLKKPNEQVNISTISKGQYMIMLSNGNTIKFRKD